MAKSKIIHDVVHENDRKLNLHEIKAQTGAGSGHKYTSTSSHQNNVDDVFIRHNKIEKIYDVLSKIEGKINLHKIKEYTGVGNGYKNASPTNATSNINSNTVSASKDAVHKSHKIHALFHNNDRKLNLHQIKAQTGAGNGYRHN